MSLISSKIFARYTLSQRYTDGVFIIRYWFHQKMKKA